MPKAIVVDDTFDWGDDRPPRRPWSRTRDLRVPRARPDARAPRTCPHGPARHLPRAGAPTRSSSTCSASASPPSSSCRCSTSLSERHLVARGLANYWGYNTIAFFAPDARLRHRRRGQQVAEFKTMVKALHRAGLEVILDVVYNHTGEGDQRGPTLSLRGIDNAAYYRLEPRPRRVLRRLHRLRQHPEHAAPAQRCSSCSTACATGSRTCTSTASASTSRRRSAAAERVDARRRLLRHACARTRAVAREADRRAVGPRARRLSGRRVPARMAEWNGRYRDRCGASGAATQGQSPSWPRGSPARATSSRGGRGAVASINFVTCHDGFTLRDLVSYEHKHNEANGEDNRDGTNDNWSRNWGVEGADRRPAVLALRDARRSAICSPRSSFAGRADAARRRRDRPHAARQQQRLLPGQRAHLDRLEPRRRRARRCSSSRARCCASCASNPVLRRRSFFQGRVGRARLRRQRRHKDVSWLRPDGEELEPTTGTSDSPRRSACSSTAEHRRERRSTAARSGRDAAAVLNGGAERTSRCRVSDAWPLARALQPLGGPASCAADPACASRTGAAAIRGASSGPGAGPARRRTRVLRAASVAVSLRRAPRRR